MCSKMTADETRETILSRAMEIGADNGAIQWFEGYAEPGYDDTPHGVCVANWNDFEELGNQLESAGIATEWCDEWTECATCNKIIREQPDSYGWLPFLLIDGNEIICLKCFREEHCERVANGWIVTRNYGYGKDEKQYVLVGAETKDQYGKDELDRWLQDVATWEFTGHKHGR